MVWGPGRTLEEASRGGKQEMCFCMCQCVAVPRRRGQSHRSSLTGSASRVASQWASLHTGHQLTALCGLAGRSLPASGSLELWGLGLWWAVAAAQAPGGELVKAGLSPRSWSVAALARPPHLTCERPTFSTSALCLGRLTRDHRLFHRMEARPHMGLQPVHTHSWGPCHLPLGQPLEDTVA